MAHAEVLLECLATGSEEPVTDVVVATVGIGQLGSGESGAADVNFLDIRLPGDFLDGAPVRIPTVEVHGRVGLGRVIAEDQLRCVLSAEDVLPINFGEQAQRPNGAPCPAPDVRCDRSPLSVVFQALEELHELSEDHEAEECRKCPELGDRERRELLI